MGEDPGFSPNSIVSDVIAAFLIDLARAQHQSNLFSAELGELYRKDPRLRVFAVPNGYIKGVNFEFRVAIEGVGIEENTGEAIRNHASSVLSDHIASLAPAIAERVAASLKDHRHAFDDPHKAERMAEAVRTAPLLDSLSQQVAERVQAQLSDLVGTEGDLREKPAADALASAFDDVFVNHVDYSPLPAAGRTALKTEIEALTAEPATMERLRTRLAARPARPEPRMRVAMSGQSFSALGPEVLGKIQLEAAIRDYVVEAQNLASQPDSPQIARFRLVPAKH